MKSGFHPTAVLSALREVLPRQRSPIGLHEPEFAGNEWRYVRECLDSGWVSSAGEYVDRFEERIAEYTGVKRAVAVVNGTAALHVCLLLAGVVPGDEVVVPALTFVATANAVSYLGAVPHFADSEEMTLGLDPTKLKDHLQDIAEVREDGCYNRLTGRRLRTVIAMHTFGHPVDLNRLTRVCGQFGMTLIEDAAESLGSFYEERHTGNWGMVSALSFNGNKTITTGGGGAVLTNDLDLANTAKHITTTAKIPHEWEYRHDRVGFNYRLPNINAALGCAQLERLPSMLERKRRLADRYERAFAPVEGVKFFVEPEFARSNYWLNALLLDPSCAAERDRVLRLTNDHGIMTRPAWALLPTLPMYRESPKMDLSVAADLEKRLINIPSSAALGGSDVLA